MPRARHVCSSPNCPTLVVTGYCDEHRRDIKREQDIGRPSASERGYDRKWARNSARFIAANPTCIDCGKPSKIPDHDPISRRELVNAGDPHPDAWHHLKPRCKPCHDARTGRTRR